MQHKFNVGDIVVHNGKQGKERAMVVGICFPTDWDIEPRYAVELMDRVSEVEAYCGMREKTLTFKIVNEATEKSLELCEPEEKSVAEVVEEIVEVEPSGV